MTPADVAVLTEHHPIASLVVAVTCSCGWNDKVEAPESWSDHLIQEAYVPEPDDPADDGDEEADDENV